MRSTVLALCMLSLPGAPSFCGVSLTLHPERVLEDAQDSPVRSLRRVGDLSCTTSPRGSELRSPDRRMPSPLLHPGPARLRAAGAVVLTAAIRSRRACSRSARVPLHSSDRPCGLSLSASRRSRHGSRTEFLLDWPLRVACPSPYPLDAAARRRPRAADAIARSREDRIGAGARGRAGNSDRRQDTVPVSLLRMLTGRSSLLLPHPLRSLKPTFRRLYAQARVSRGQRSGLPGSHP